MVPRLRSGRRRLFACILVTSCMFVWDLLGPCAAPVRAQPAEGGARSVGLGGATTALSEDAWGHANPAAWATVPGRTVAFFASEGYGMRELRLGAAQYVEPLPFGAIALGVRTYGFEAYRETRLEIGFARGLRLGSLRRLYAGLRLRAERVDVAGYGSATAYGLSAGGMVEVFPSLTFGFAATNVNVPRWGRHEELPRTLSLGLAYVPTENVRVVLDTVKEVRFPASVRSGVEVRLVPALALRTGVATAPVRYTAGVGIRIRPLAVDAAAIRHDVLGWTPALSLGLHWQ